MLDGISNTSKIGINNILRVVRKNLVVMLEKISHRIIITGLDQNIYGSNLGLGIALQD